MKKSSKALRDWKPVEITKHKDSEGNRLQIPAGTFADFDGHDFPSLLIRLRGKNKARSLASAEWIDPVEGQDKVRVSSTLWTALGVSAVQYAPAEIQRATLAARIRHDSALRSYLTAALIAFVGACFGVAAATSNPPAWVGIASALMTPLGIALAVFQKVRGRD